MYLVNPMNPLNKTGRLLSQVPQLTRDAPYRVDVSWDYVEPCLARWAEMLGGEGRGGLDLDPDFQRGHVWDEARRVAYVEYVLRGGKSSRELHWNCPGWMNDFRGPMVLVDGKQRLEAVRRFMRGELGVFGGHPIGDWDDGDRHFLRHSFSFHVNSLPTRAATLRWYLELNEGGVAHDPAELARVRALLAAER